MALQCWNRSNRIARTSRSTTRPASENLLKLQAATDPAGSWSIEIETPLGQSIPATLTISRTGSGYTAVIHSEMGDADLGAIEINNNSFHATTSLEMDGHAVEAEVSAKFDGDQTEGTSEAAKLA